MNLEAIKLSIQNGKRVYWKNTGYQVIKDNLGQYLIKCTWNGSCIGLTWADNKTMNGKPEDFFDE